MLSILKKIQRSESKVDDTISLIISGFASKFKFIKSRKVYFKNEGKLNIKGKLFFGFLSNRIGLDPSGKGVFRIYKGGEFYSEGNVKIARSCKLYVVGKITIGDGTYINPNTILFARKNISIGEQCAISWNCQIVDDDFHSIDGGHNSSEGIFIGNNVWIGANVQILKGVHIGNGAVIAAGSVITKDIPERCVAAGIPAKIIRQNITWK